jgi:hypothetical protein
LAHVELYKPNLCIATLIVGHCATSAAGLLLGAYQKKKGSMTAYLCVCVHVWNTHTNTRKTNDRQTNS